VKLESLTWQPVHSLWWEIDVTYSILGMTGKLSNQHDFKARERDSKKSRPSMVTYNTRDSAYFIRGETVQWKLDSAYYLISKLQDDLQHYEVLRLCQ
jgi:hypothetical protein